MTKDNQIKSIGGVEINPNFGTVPPQDVARRRVLPRERDAGGAGADAAGTGIRRFVMDRSTLLWEQQRTPALLFLIKSGGRPTFTLESACAAPPSCPFLQQMSHCLATFIKIPLTKLLIESLPSPTPQHSARRSGRRCSRSLSLSCGTTRAPKLKLLCPASPLPRRRSPAASPRSPGLTSHIPEPVVCVLQMDCTCSRRSQQHNPMQKMQTGDF